MPQVSIKDLEDAINVWRNRFPSPEGEATLCRQASALATPYARAIVEREQSIPLTDDLMELVNSALSR